MSDPTEPVAANLHFVVRWLRPVHAFLIRVLERYYANARHWVILTTRGRRSGLPRQVLLPCGRSAEAVIVISTYGNRSDWIRNLRKDPSVTITWAGRTVPGKAEVVEDVARKQAIVSEHPFFAPAPIAIVHAVMLTVLRPLTVFGLRRWVVPRPVVVIRRDQSGQR
jgi:deazaflavin-dependent oxidoreductase (nitroreductase family)